MRCAARWRCRSWACGAAANRFDHLPYAIAQHQDVLAVPAAPQDGAARDRANRFLAGVAQRASLSALYVMNIQGSTLAASNWDSLTSFVGQSYRDRPYFIEARNGRTGQFYGVGLTTGVPGYFIAAPARQDGKDIVGVVAVKVSLDSIESAWALVREPILLSDARGIVFLGNVPAWQYRMTRPLSVMELEWLRYFKQYGEKLAFEPVPWRREPGDAVSGHRVRALLDGKPRNLLAIDEVLPEFGWNCYRHRRPPAGGAGAADRLGAIGTAASDTAARRAVLAPARTPLHRAASGPPRPGAAR